MKNKTDIRELFRDYIDECQYSRRLRPDTIRGYKAIFGAFLNAMPEVKTLDDIRVETIQTLFRRLQTRTRIVGRNTEKVGIKASTARSYYNKLGSFFQWLQMRGHIERDPMAQIKAPVPVYDDHKALEHRDVQKIIAAVCLHSKNNLIRKRDTAMIALLLYCGLRRGELAGLRVSDVNLANRVLRVRGETSKSRHTRELPIHSVLEQHLRDYIAERNKQAYKTECLFVSSTADIGLTKHGLKHWVNRLSALSGVRFHLHQFRHTFTNNLGAQNTSAIMIQKLLGHTDLRMTQRYLRSMSVEDLRGEVNRLQVDTSV